MVDFRWILAAGLGGWVALPSSSMAVRSQAPEYSAHQAIEHWAIVGQASSAPSRPAEPPAEPSSSDSSSHRPRPPFSLWWWLLLPLGLAAALYRQKARSAPQSAQPEAAPVSETNSAERSAELLKASAAAITLSPAPPLVATRLAKIDIVEALVADLQDPDAAKRRKAIWDLGQLGDTRAMQPLVDLLIDSDSQQRSLILGAVSEISSRSLKPMNRALMLALQDESPDVRRNAIRDVTRVYELMTQVGQLLQYAANDSDSEVQETAHWALNQLNRMQSLRLASDSLEMKPKSPADMQLAAKDAEFDRQMLDRQMLDCQINGPANCPTTEQAASEPATGSTNEPITGAE